MKFDQKDYDRVCTYTTTGELGYVIMLGGKPFMNGSRKSVFRTKSSAMYSLNNTISWKVRTIVEEKLMALGMTRDEVQKDAEYINTWQNFVKQAKADGFLQITTLK